MVFMADMGQLMHHHILDGLRGIGHQVQGEAEAVFPGAAAKSCPGGGDPDPGGPDAHDPGPIGYPLGQVSLGLPAKGLLLLRGGLRVLRPIPGLTLLLAAAFDWSLKRLDAALFRRKTAVGKAENKKIPESAKNR